jgi:uncharacterized membrane protein
MMKTLPLMYVLGAILCWGAYVPTIHAGQLGFGEPKGPIRAFLFIGVAYSLVALAVPALVLYVGKAEPLVFPVRGMSISTLAGILGAAGALCVIFALRTGGTPLTVPPLVFAGAPIVATLIAMILHRPSQAPSPLFFLGIVLAAAGAALVLRFKPV